MPAFDLRSLKGAGADFDEFALPQVALSGPFGPFRAGRTLYDNNGPAKNPGAKNRLPHPEPAEGLSPISPNNLFGEATIKFRMVNSLCRFPIDEALEIMIPFGREENALKQYRKFIENIFERFRGFRTVYLVFGDEKDFYGDPSACRKYLTREFMDVVRSASEHFQNVHIVTNGSLIDDDSEKAKEDLGRFNKANLRWTLYFNFRKIFEEGLSAAIGRKIKVMEKLAREGMLKTEYIIGTRYVQDELRGWLEKTLISFGLLGKHVREKEYVSFIVEDLPPCCVSLGAKSYDSDGLKISFVYIYTDHMVRTVPLADFNERFADIFINHGCEIRNDWGDVFSLKYLDIDYIMQTNSRQKNALALRSRTSISIPEIFDVFFEPISQYFLGNREKARSLLKAVMKGNDKIMFIKILYYFLSHAQQFDIRPFIEDFLLDHILFENIKTSEQLSLFLDSLEFGKTQRIYLETEDLKWLGFPEAAFSSEGDVCCPLYRSSQSLRSFSRIRGFPCFKDAKCKDPCTSSYALYFPQESLGQAVERYARSCHLAKLGLVPFPLGVFYSLEHNEVFYIEEALEYTDTEKDKIILENWSCFSDLFDFVKLYKSGYNLGAFAARLDNLNYKIPYSRHWASPSLDFKVDIGKRCDGQFVFRIVDNPVISCLDEVLSLNKTDGFRATFEHYGFLSGREYVSRIIFEIYRDVQAYLGCQTKAFKKLFPRIKNVLREGFYKGYKDGMVSKTNRDILQGDTLTSGGAGRTGAPDSLLYLLTGNKSWGLVGAFAEAVGLAVAILGLASAYNGIIIAGLILFLALLHVFIVKTKLCPTLNFHNLPSSIPGLLCYFTLPLLAYLLILLHPYLAAVAVFIHLLVDIKRMGGIFTSLPVLALAIVLFLSSGNRIWAQGRNEDILSKYVIKTPQTIGQADNMTPDVNAVWLKKFGVSTVKTRDDIDNLLLLHHYFEDSVNNGSYIIEPRFTSMFQTLRRIDDTFDNHPLQREIIRSGEDLEFDQGLIYHCLPDLVKTLINNRVDGEIYLTRFPADWATYHFIDGSPSPAILAMKTGTFNRLIREGKAYLYVQRKEKEYWVDVDRIEVKYCVEPYPKVFKGLSLDDVEEIWVTNSDYKAYSRVAFAEDDSVLSENEQKLLPARALIKQLIESGKLQPVFGLSRFVPLKQDSLEKTAIQLRDVFADNFLAVGVHMGKRGLFEEVPFLKIQGQKSPFGKIDKTELAGNVLLSQAQEQKREISSQLWRIGLALLGIVFSTIWLFIRYIRGLKIIKFRKALYNYSPPLAKSLTRKQIKALLKLKKPTKEEVKRTIRNKGGEKVRISGDAYRGITEILITMRLHVKKVTFLRLPYRFRAPGVLIEQRYYKGALVGDDVTVQFSINGKKYKVGREYYLAIKLANGKKIYWGGLHNLSYSFFFEHYKEQAQEIIRQGGLVWRHIDTHWDCPVSESDTDRQRANDEDAVVDWQAEVIRGHRSGVMSHANYVKFLIQKGCISEFQHASNITDRKFIKKPYSGVALTAWPLEEMAKQEFAGGVFDFDADELVGYRSNTSIDDGKSIFVAQRPYLLSIAQKSEVCFFINTAIPEYIRKGYWLFIDPHIAVWCFGCLIEDLSASGDSAWSRPGKSRTQVKKRYKILESIGFQAAGFMPYSGHEQEMQKVKEWYRLLGREDRLLFIESLISQGRILRGEDTEEVFFGANNRNPQKPWILIAANENDYPDATIIHEIEAILTGDHKQAEKTALDYIFTKNCGYPQQVRITAHKAEEITWESQPMQKSILALEQFKTSLQNAGIEEIFIYAIQLQIAYRQNVRQIAQRLSQADTAKGLAEFIQTCRERKIAEVSIEEILSDMASREDIKEIIPVFKNLTEVLNDTGVIAEIIEHVLKAMVDIDKAETVCRMLTRSEVALALVHLSAVYVRGSESYAKCLPSIFAEMLKGYAERVLSAYEIEELLQDLCAIFANLSRSEAERKEIESQAKQANLSGDFAQKIIRIVNGDWQGSGFVIGHLDGRYIILTNTHVVKDRKSVTIASKAGEEIGEAGVIICNRDVDCADKDLALLEISEDAVRKNLGRELVPFSVLTEFSQGQMATLVSGCNGSVFTGYLFRVRGTVYLLGAKTTPGDSGSPYLVKINNAYFAVAVHARDVPFGMALSPGTITAMASSIEVKAQAKTSNVFRKVEGQGSFGAARECLSNLLAAEPSLWRGETGQLTRSDNYTGRRIKALLYPIFMPDDRIIAEISVSSGVYGPSGTTASLIASLEQNKILDAPGKRLLVLGCGSGSDTLYAISKGYIPDAIDHNRQAVEDTKSNLRKNNLQDKANVFFHEGLTGLGRYDIIIWDAPEPTETTEPDGCCSISLSDFEHFLEELPQHLSYQGIAVIRVSAPGALKLFLEKGFTYRQLFNDQIALRWSSMFTLPSVFRLKPVQAPTEKSACALAHGARAERKDLLGSADAGLNKAGDKNRIASNSCPLPVEFDIWPYNELVRVLAQQGINYAGQMNLSPNALNIVCNLRGIEEDAAMVRHLDRALASYPNVNFILVGRQDLFAISSGLIVRRGRLYSLAPHQNFAAHCFIMPPESMPNRNILVLPEPLTSFLYDKAKQHQFLEEHHIASPELPGSIPPAGYLEDAEKNLAAILATLSKDNINVICIKPESSAYGEGIFIVGTNNAYAVEIARWLKSHAFTPRGGAPRTFLVERYIESIAVDLEPESPAYFIPEGEIAGPVKEKGLKQLKNNVRLVVVKSPTGQWQVKSKTVRLGAPYISRRTLVAMMFWEDFLKIIHFPGEKHFSEEQQLELDKKIDRIACAVAEGLDGEGYLTYQVAVDLIISDEYDGDGLPKCYVNEFALDFTFEVAEDIDLILQATGRQRDAEKYFAYLPATFATIISILHKRFPSPKPENRTLGDTGRRNYRGGGLHQHHGYGRDMPDVGGSNYIGWQPGMFSIWACFKDGSGIKAFQDDNPDNASHDAGARAGEDGKNRNVPDNVTSTVRRKEMQDGMSICPCLQRVIGLMSNSRYLSIIKKVEEECPYLVDTAGIFAGRYLKEAKGLLRGYLKEYLTLKNFLNNPERDKELCKYLLAILLIYQNLFSFLDDMNDYDFVAGHILLYAKFSKNYHNADRSFKIGIPYIKTFHTSHSLIATLAHEVAHQHRDLSYIHQPAIEEVIADLGEFFILEEMGWAEEIDGEQRDLGYWSTARKKKSLMVTEGHNTARVQLQWIIEALQEADYPIIWRKLFRLSLGIIKKNHHGINFETFIKELLRQYRQRLTQVGKKNERIFSVVPTNNHNSSKHRTDKMVPPAIIRRIFGKKRGGRTGSSTDRNYLQSSVGLSGRGGGGGTGRKSSTQGLNGFLGYRRLPPGVKVNPNNLYVRLCRERSFDQADFMDSDVAGRKNDPTLLSMPFGFQRAFWRDLQYELFRAANSPGFADTISIRSDLLASGVGISTAFWRGGGEINGNVPNNVPAKTTQDKREVFPLYLEIGCGDSFWIIEQAKRNPDRNYVIIEINRQKGYQIKKAALPNLKIIYDDAKEIVEKIFVNSQPEEIYINFPSRSLLDYSQQDMHFFQDLFAILKEGGKIKIVTEDCDYVDLVLKPLYQTIKGRKTIHLSTNIPRDTPLFSADGRCRAAIYIEVTKLPNLAPGPGEQTPAGAGDAGPIIPLAPAMPGIAWAFWRSDAPVGPRDSGKPELSLKSITVNPIVNKRVRIQFAGGETKERIVVSGEYKLTDFPLCLMSRFGNFAVAYDRAENVLVMKPVYFDEKRGLQKTLLFSVPIFMPPVSYSVYVFSLDRQREFRFLLDKNRKIKDRQGILRNAPEEISQKTTDALIGLEQEMNTHNIRGIIKDLEKANYLIALGIEAEGERRLKPDGLNIAVAFNFDVIEEHSIPLMAEFKHYPGVNAFIILNHSWLWASGSQLLANKGLILASYGPRQCVYKLLKFKRPQSLHYVDLKSSDEAYQIMINQTAVPCSRSLGFEAITSNKIWMDRILVERGIPVPSSISFIHPHDERSCFYGKACRSPFSEHRVNYLPLSYNEKDIRGALDRFRRKYPAVWVKSPEGSGGYGIRRFGQKVSTVIIAKEILERLYNGESVMVQEDIDTPLIRNNGVNEDYNFRVFVVPYDYSSFAIMPMLVRIDRAGGPVNISLTAQWETFDELIELVRINPERAWRIRCGIECVSSWAVNAIKDEARVLAGHGMISQREADEVDFCGGDVMWRSNRLPVVIEMNGVNSGGLWELHQRLTEKRLKDGLHRACELFAKNAIRRAGEYKQKELKEQRRAGLNGSLPVDKSGGAGGEMGGLR